MFDKIQWAIEDIALWKMIIVVDDESRENEWDLVMAWELVKSQDINFMIKEARWLVCTPVWENIVKRLWFEPMVKKIVKWQNICNFAISVDAKADIDSGISAEDRMITIQKIVDKNSKPEDFIAPGHTFPLLAKKWWVLERMGHTEASIDFVKFAKLEEVAVICEIINEDWTMARVPDLIKFWKKWWIKIVTIEDLVKYRKENK